MPFRAGKLDRRVTLKKYVPVRSDTGAVLSNYEDPADKSYAFLAVVWAQYKNVPPLKSSAEITEGGEWSADNYATWTMRYRSDISAKDTITDEEEGIVWDIQSVAISNLSLRRELIECLAKERQTK